MIPVAILTIGLHLYVLFQATSYFRSGTCRNADRSIIAAMALSSLALIVAQGGYVCALVLGWGGRSPLESFLAAFSMFNGVLYQGVLQTFQESREQRTLPHPTTKGTPA